MLYTGTIPRRRFFVSRASKELTQRRPAKKSVIVQVLELVVREALPVEIVRDYLPLVWHRRWSWMNVLTSPVDHEPGIVQKKGKISFTINYTSGY